MKIFFAVAFLIAGVVCIGISVMDFYVNGYLFIVGCFLILVAGAYLFNRYEDAVVADKRYRDHLDRMNRK